MSSPGPLIYCAVCGRPNPTINRFCAECGAQIVRVERPAPEAQPQQEVAPETERLSAPRVAAPTSELREVAREEMAPMLEALLFPFKNPAWPVRLWWLPLINLIQPIGIIAMRGWRLDITRRMARSDPDRLPKMLDLGRFFGDGVVLWMMTGIYFIPQIIIITLFAPGLLENILAALVFFWGLITNTATMSLGQFAAQILLGLLTQSAVPAAYALLSLPIYRTAMLRYAITGNMLVFFDFVTSVRLCAKYFSGVMGAVFATLAANFVIGVAINFFLAATVIGAILIPLVTIPLSYWVVGYIYGRLAEQMVSDLH